MTDQQEYAGRVAIITGGGRGFGKAFAHAIADRGGHAVLADIDLAAAEAAATEIRDVGGGASAVGCDVAAEADVDRLIAEVVASHGGIDVLINNAGLHSAEYGQPMGVLGTEKVRRLFDVNIMGVVLCTLAARSALAARQGACVFNISSSAAYASGGAYGVSKLAVRGLTMAFARELGPDGIRVNAVAPGLHLTDTIRAAFERDDRGGAEPADPSPGWQRARHCRDDAVSMLGPSSFLSPARRSGLQPATHSVSSKG